VRVLFIGGTGLISSGCGPAALAAGHELWLMNRGRSPLESGVAPERILTADTTDEDAVRRAVGDRHFDVVVQFVAYRPAQIEIDARVFASTGQYVFISSASVYQKPPRTWHITESVPKANPFWSYARDKIACEEALRAAHAADGFPMTIVRPSLTYGPSQVPVVVGSWARPYTIIDRMRRNRPIIVPGDGTTIWTMTHHEDFATGLVGLFGQPGAIGEDFHITSDEVLTWNEIYRCVAEAAGVSASLLHVPSDAIVASDPAEEGNLFGDKAYCAVFDNAKLRRLVPGFTATTRFADGIRATVEWFDADPARRLIDDAANARWDDLAALYADALRRAAG
jgi:nucleoside-diphosphate-sugar epimerase